jgi:thiamine transport system substrate-binding protein
MRAVVALGLALACAFGTIGCSSTAKSASTVTLMTHDSFAASPSVIQAFEQQTGVKVKVLKSGDAGVELNQAILTKDHPLADAMFGVDNTFLSRALSENVFAPYTAHGLDSVIPEFAQLDPRHRVTPVDYGDICINDDLRYFGHDGHPPAPASLDDLTKPAYKGLTVVENPAESSPGLGFMLATISKYGAGWQQYWKALRANHVRVDDSWDQAYDGDFSAGGGSGKYPLVVSYASSPPADVVFSKPAKSTPSLGTIYTTCFRQVEFVGVLRGAKHPDLARRLVDFMITQRFQRDVPLQMYVYPVVPGTPLPPVFVKFGQLAPHPWPMSPATIGANRDEWIKQWTDIVVR